MTRIANASNTVRLLMCLTLLVMFAGILSAQTVLNLPTTTTLWAGTADFNANGLSSITAPASGVILQGSAINPNTGKPFRHMWYGDASNGLCRIDPDMDTAPAPVAGIGNFNNVQLTCIGTIQAPGFIPGQLAFDAATNSLYATNISRTGQGVIRFKYIPSGNNGHGQIDPVHITVLAGTQGTRNAVGGCPLIGDPNKAGNPIPQTAEPLALGPDGNLYEGFFRSGAVVRFLSPATFDPTSSDCQNKMSVPLTSADERINAGHNFGLGWIGHDLYGADNIAPYILTNADKCLTPANGNKACPPNTGTEILGAFIGGPQGGLVTDQILSGPNAFPGNTFYAATLSAVTRVTNLTSVVNLTMTPQYGGTFCQIFGLTLDTTDLANETLYVGSDCTGGGINGAGSIWQVKPAAPAPGPPVPPVTVTASNSTPIGAATGSATVSWTPGFNGQPTTSYVVRTLLASGGASAVADKTAAAVPPSTVVPTTTTITGLTLGTAYVFEVEACNLNGCSAFSPASNSVTAAAPTVPGAPTNLSAAPGNSSASLAWTAPSDGGSPITSYVIKANDTTKATSSTSTITGPANGALVSGLTNGDTYTFTLHAVNAVGAGAESAASIPILLPVPVGTAMAGSVTAPASVNNGPQGVQIAYVVTATNNGPADAPDVQITSTLPGALVSATPSVGACAGAVGGTSLSCNMGAMKAGTSVTLNVSVLISSAVSGNVTGTFNTQAFTATGASLGAAVPASATTNVVAQAGGGGGVSADVQVGGAAQNGGPNSPASDVITWQVRNATGNVNVSNVTFTSNTSSPNMTFTSVSTSLGTCSLTGTQALSCSAPTLNGGTTMLVTVTTQISGPGTAVANGSANFAGTDTNPANNTGSVTINAK